MSLFTTNGGNLIVFAVGGHKGSAKGTNYLQTTEFYQIQHDRWLWSGNTTIGDRERHQHVIVRRTTSNVAEVFYINNKKRITRLKRTYDHEAREAIWKFDKYHIPNIIAEEDLTKIEWVMVYNDDPE